MQRFATVQVSTSAHARQRWQQLKMKGDPEYAVAWRLFEKLRCKKGAVLDKYGAIHLYIQDEVYAVVAADLYGGWKVVTFYLPGAILGDNKGDDGNGECDDSGGGEYGDGNSGNGISVPQNADIS